MQVPSRLQALGPAFTRWITANNSSNYGRFSSAVLLHPDEQECHEETCLHASLELLLDYLCASFQPPPVPSVGFSIGYQTEISSGHGCDSSAELLQMDETGGDMIPCRPSSLAMLLVYMSAILQSPPSHWPSPPYDDFISSGLRSLYKCPLRGLPIAPARRGNGSCRWVRS